MSELSSFDPAPLRAQFPALAQAWNGRPALFFDNPGGTQVPQRVIDAVARYFREQNANSGGAFLTSQRTDAVVAAAREAMADLLNAPSPETIVFGPNMTTLTFHLARSIAETIRPGDEIVVTDLDHDANVTPWTDLQAAGAVIRAVGIEADGTLDPAAIAAVLTERTRLVAIPYASNAIGTIPDAAAITRLAHAAGAWVFVDAVQYAPHGPIDVQALDCDFLACSAYKFFGPHVGILFGKLERLTRLTPHRVRPARDEIPYRWETGTQNHEGMAGVAAAVDYLAEIGERFGGAWREGYAAQGYAGRRLTLKTAMSAIKEYEQTLSAHLLAGLEAIDGLRVYGLADRNRLHERVPTVAFTWLRLSPRATAEHLAARGIACWSGNYYALRLMESLGLEATGGAVRIGCAHYNTTDEIDALLRALQETQR
jgi:cysteine desulfurase family protein (TIGR01976 family)